jgi:hypothetical protein
MDGSLRAPLLALIRSVRNGACCSASFRRPVDLTIAGALVPHRHALRCAADESAVSIAVANEIVTAVGEFRGIPGIRAISNESAVDVDVGTAAPIGAGECHHA